MTSAASVAAVQTPGATGHAGGAAGQAGASALSRIGAYRPASGFAYPAGSGAPVVVLRSFTLGGQPRWLVVNPDIIATESVSAEGLRFEARPWLEVRETIARTPYGRALDEGRKNEGLMADAGVTHLRPGQPGIDLTVDLCPSSRPLDRRLFRTLIGELGRIERPVPVAIAITGVWMRQHPADLLWLIDLDRSRQLAITWVNHSFNHRVGPNRPLASNFLLEPGTDVDEEVLATERALLERGLLPSVFFRFPGLISSSTLVERILSFGLVPVGSDAWLAKSEWPKSGSIVLVHANGNEPLGVSRFIDLLRRERTAIHGRRWLLLDLRESLLETGRNPRR